MKNDLCAIILLNINCSTIRFLEIDICQAFTSRSHERDLLTDEYSLEFCSHLFRGKLQILFQILLAIQIFSEY